MASIHLIDVIIRMRKEIMIPDFVKVGLFGQVRPVGEVSYFLQLLRFIELEIAKNFLKYPNYSKYQISKCQTMNFEKGMSTN